MENSVESYQEPIETMWLFQNQSLNLAPILKRSLENVENSAKSLVDIISSVLKKKINDSKIQKLARQTSDAIGIAMSPTR